MTSASAKSRALAAGEKAHLDLGLVAAEAETGKLGAHGAGLGLRQKPRHVQERRVLGRQFLDVMLGEIADPQPCARGHAAGHERQLARQQARQGRLAVAVAAKEGDPVVGIDPQVDAREHRLARAIADRGAGQREERRAQLAGTGEIENEGRVIGHGLDRLHPRERLHAALRLARGVRLVAPAIDIGLQLLPLGLLAQALRFALRPTLAALALELIVAAGIERQLAVLQMEDVVGNVVEEVALVARHHQRRAVGAEELLEPDHQFKIEMVRRFVEQQQIGLGKKQRRQGRAHAPAAGERRQRPMLRRLVKAQAREDAARPGRGGVAVDRLDAIVDVADALGIAGRLGLGLGQKVGAFGIGGEHRLERRRRAPRCLLGEIADPRIFRRLHRALVGLGE